MKKKSGGRFLQQRSAATPKKRRKGGVIVCVVFLLCVVGFLYFLGSENPAEPTIESKTNPMDMKLVESTEETSIKEMTEEMVKYDVAEAAVEIAPEKPTVEIAGRYTFGDGYSVEFTKEELYPETGEYYFSVVFNLNENDYIAGYMTIGETVTFDGYTSNDEGTLTFTVKDDSVFMELSSARHGYFAEKLILEETIDYTHWDLSAFYGTYASPSGFYEITLGEGFENISFFVEVRYSNGEEDGGFVTPGVESYLNNAAIMLKPTFDGNVDILLYSVGTTSGQFEETLYRKAANTTPETAPAVQTLANLSGAELFYALSEIERRCADMQASNVINRPSRFCDGEIYRFTGEVVNFRENRFLLRITSALENDLIICDSDELVSLGEEVCVYGVGKGSATYTRTYENGSKTEFETLLLEECYLIHQDVEISLGNQIPDYAADLVYGNYIISYFSSAFEQELQITSDTINGRPYTIEEVFINFVYPDATEDLGHDVRIEMMVSTTDRRGRELHANFSFSLDDLYFTYTAASDYIGLDHSPFRRQD